MMYEFDDNPTEGMRQVEQKIKDLHSQIARLVAEYEHYERIVYADFHECMTNVGSNPHG